MAVRNELSLFSNINKTERWAVPSKRFWDEWNSPRRVSLQRAGYLPRPEGESVGIRQKWIVYLPETEQKTKPLVGGIG